MPAVVWAGVSTALSSEPSPLLRAVRGLAYMGGESPGRRPEPHPEKRGSELSARPCPELLPTSGFYGAGTNYQEPSGENHTPPLPYSFRGYSLGAAGEKLFPCRFPPLEAVHTPPSCHSGPYLGRTNVPLVPPAPSCPNSWARQKITSDWAVGLRGGASSHPVLSVPTPSTGFRNTFSTRCFVLLGCQICLDGWHSGQEPFISLILRCSSNARGFTDLCAFLRSVSCTGFANISLGSFNLLREIELV